jgi:hypothetical protein
VEIYDVVKEAGATERVINLSTRAISGAGAATLIAGFVIDGMVPKRVLVRGAGPALARFGVSDALVRPRIAVFSGDALLAENTGWATSADSALLQQSATQVGAFSFEAGSGDSALVLNLSPGSYTAQISGAAETSGTALVEIYEIR